MKIAFLLPHWEWSVGFSLRGLAKYVMKLSEHTVDIFPHREMNSQLLEYDLIVGAIKFQNTYNNIIFERIRDKFIASNMGFSCYDRINNWGIFKYVWTISDSLIRKDVAEKFSDTIFFSQPYGVNPEIFKPSNEPKKFFTGFIGNATNPRKRVKDLFIPLCEDVGVSYIMHNSKENGFVPYEKLADFYNQLECYMCTSVWEGGCSPIIEGASCGLPIIGCNTGFNPMFKRKANFVCNSYKEYAEALSMLKNDEELRRKMGIEARQEILDNWTWEKTTLAWLKKIKELGFG